MISTTVPLEHSRLQLERLYLFFFSNHFYFVSSVKRNKARLWLKVVKTLYLVITPAAGKRVHVNWVWLGQRKRQATFKMLGCGPWRTSKGDEVPVTGPSGFANWHLAHVEDQQTSDTLMIETVQLGARRWHFKEVASESLRRQLWWQKISISKVQSLDL